MTVGVFKKFNINNKGVITVINLVLKYTCKNM